MFTLPFAFGFVGNQASSIYFWVLLYIGLFGLVWDCLYHLLQQFLWDHDWPGVLQFLAAVVEAIFLGGLIKFFGLPHISPSALNTSDAYEFRGGGGHYYDDYQLYNVIPGDSITVTLNSQSFDTWLAIYDSGTGSLLYYDDNGGLGTNSQLTFTPQVGDEYIVSVSTAGSNSTGDYIVSAFS